MQPPISQSKRRLFWLVPSLIALFAFFGGLASNLVASDLEPLLAPYRVWVWGLSGVSLVVAVAAAIWEVRHRETDLDAALKPAPDPVESRSVDLKGGGAAVIGDQNVVAGQKGASVGRDVRDSVVATGDNPVVIVAEHFMSNLPTEQKAVPELKEVTVTYLEYLISRYRYLDFRGMGMADRVPLRLPLVEMYVPLKARVEVPSGETWARDLQIAGRSASEEEAMAIGERLSEPTSLIELLAKHEGLIVLGDPGAGKTTFLKYLTLRLACGEGEALGLAGRLPILVPLSAYANSLAEQDVALQHFLGAYYRNRGVDLPITELIDAALQDGRALLLLDGLDEVQLVTQRALVVERVVDFFSFYRSQGNKFIITSRIVGYRDVRRTAEGLAECTLIDFDQEDIADFVEKWTDSIERAAKGESSVSQEAAKDEQRELLYAVEHNSGVRQLATNPLLLTILALMKRQGVVLPERRAELYDAYVAILLRHWNLARGLDGRNKRLLDERETLRVLAPLALWMHETSPGVGLVKREEMRRQLEEIYRQREEPDPERAAEQLLADARDHAGLLLERGPGEYGFIHLTFQEYLAAVAIAQKGQRDEEPVVALLAEHVEEIAWHEVTLLTIGYLGLVQQRDEAAGAALEQLIAKAPGAPGAATVLAGDAVIDTWPGGVTQRCKNLVAEALLATMMDPAVTPPVRANAGSALSALGDPRDLDIFLPVLGGPFLMGSIEGHGHDNEHPQHEVNVEEFHIGKYPVTNGQYAAFVKATGHRAPSHWRGSSPPPRLCNHPVVAVTWHDAIAYCDWLSQELGKLVRLPTEAEWEKAARGTDGRIYPWGDEYDAAYCNAGETKIGSTSPVGIFAKGNSPYGCVDMAGNVWEWTSSQYKAYPYDAADGREDPNSGGRRTLRGGSFSLIDIRVRCAYRYDNDPIFEFEYHGFRVVVVDASPGF